MHYQQRLLRFQPQYVMMVLYIQQVLLLVQESLWSGIQRVLVARLQHSQVLQQQVLLLHMQQQKTVQQVVRVQQEHL